MTIPTFTPPVGPSPSTAFKPQIKVLEAEFGDGYNQPTPDGINNIRQNIDLRWDGLTEREMQLINRFFTSLKGTEPFYYMPAGYSTPGKWTSKLWTRNLDDGFWKMTTTLVQSCSADS